MEKMSEKIINFETVLLIFSFSVFMNVDKI